MFYLKFYLFIKSMSLLITYYVCLENGWGYILILIVFYDEYL